MANAITIARILLAIPFAALFFVSASWAMKAALAVFAFAAISDFLDGYVARARNEVSALGAALDPVADKILVGAALLLLTRNGVISGPGVGAALLILAREFLVGGLREALAGRSLDLPVTGLAKWKTASQMVAIGLLLAGAPGGLLGARLAPIADGALWLSAILTLWTGADYAARGAMLLRTQAKP